MGFQFVLAKLNKSRDYRWVYFLYLPITAHLLLISSFRSFVVVEIHWRYSGVPRKEARSEGRLNLL